MRATLQAACLSILIAGLCVSPARAQLASYVDDRGNLVYINANSPKPAPTLPTAKSSAVAGQPASAAAAAKPGNSASVQPTSFQAGGTPATNATQAPSATLTSSTSPFSQSPIPQSLDRIVQETAEKHNVDPQLVRAVISTESNWNTAAVSSKGALGLMQLVPETAQLLGVGNAFDPAQNVDAGVRYLSMLLDRYNGDLPKALAAYNAGPGVVDRYNGVPNYPETRHYVEKVTATYMRPGPDGQRAWGSPHAIYRTTDSSGRVVFTNE